MPDRNSVIGWSINVSLEVKERLNEMRNKGLFANNDEVLRHMLDMPPLRARVKANPLIERPSQNFRWPWSKMNVGDQKVFPWDELRAHGSLARCDSSLRSYQHRHPEKAFHSVALPDGYAVKRVA